MHVCISWGKKCLVFQKIWHALFSGNPHFKIHPFTLLPMNYATKAHWKNAQGVDMPKFLEKVDLASLKSEIDKLDTRKLVN